MNYPAHAHIPPYILDGLWNALLQPTENLPHLSALMASTISAPVSIDELRAAIKLTPTTSVPGPSGLSYAMMKEWSAEVLEVAHEALTQIWETSTIPDWWQWK